MGVKKGTLPNGLIIVILLLLTSNTFAVDAGDLISGEFLNLKRERVQIAKDIKLKIEKLDSCLPTPKPSDIAWIDQEQVAIEKIIESDLSNPRIKQLYDSPEFQNYRLKNLVRSIISSLECIINDDISLRSETLCWAVLSMNLSDEGAFNDAIMILKRNNKLPTDIEKKTCPTMLYSLYSRGIMEYIVIPYLSGEK